jgi:hypothetical protein
VVVKEQPICFEQPAGNDVYAGADGIFQLSHPVRPFSLIPHLCFSIVHPSKSPRGCSRSEFSFSSLKIHQKKFSPLELINPMT